MKGKFWPLLVLPVLRRFTSARRFRKRNVIVFKGYLARLTVWIKAPFLSVPGGRPKEACVSLRIQEEKRLLPRGVKLLRYERADAAERVANGSVETGVNGKNREDPCPSQHQPHPYRISKGQLEFIASQEVQETQIHFDDRTPVPYSAQEFAPDTGAIYAFSHNTAGMLGCHILCQSPATVYFVFDEILVDGDIQFMRADCASILKYELQPGEYDLLSYEPYVMKYVKVLVLGGTCQVRDLHIRQVICPDISAFPTPQKSLCGKFMKRPARPSGKTQWISIWTVPVGSGPVGSATAFGLLG